MSMAELVPGGVPWTEEDDHGNPDADLSMSPAQLARYHVWQAANVVPGAPPWNATGVTLELPDGTILKGSVCENNE